MMDLMEKQKWDYKLGFKPGNHSAYCVVFETLVSNEALQWGLEKLTGQTHELVLGEPYSMPLEQIKKQEFSVLNATPLKKIKSLKVITKKCTEYVICKKKEGIHLKIVVEGLREV
jgi:hypothetical protein